MSSELNGDSLRLSANRDGAVRVAGTGVTLGMLTAAFREGLTAVEISEQ